MNTNTITIGNVELDYFDPGAIESRGSSGFSANLEEQVRLTEARLEGMERGTSRYSLYSESLKWRLCRSRMNPSCERAEIQFGEDLDSKWKSLSLLLEAREDSLESIRQVQEEVRALLCERGSAVDLMMLQDLQREMEERERAKQGRQRQEEEENPRKRPVREDSGYGGGASAGLDTLGRVLTQTGVFSVDSVHGSEDEEAVSPPSKKRSRVSKKTGTLAKIHQTLGYLDSMKLQFDSHM